MAAAFPNLFSPLRIGSVELRNRLFVPPHGITFPPGHGGAIDRVIDYHVERAKGGVGLVVMSNYVWPASWERMGDWGGTLPRTPLGGLDLVSNDVLVPHYTRMAKGIHAEGARFFVQLNSGGRQGGGPGLNSFKIPLWAPSAIPCPETREIPKAMEIEDIEEYVAAFVQGATNARKAGADGVELFAAQGYLLSEFLSPHTNIRTDRYGGSLENRMRFVVESLQAIRRATGDDFVIGIRMNGDDYTPGGLTLPDAQQIATRLRRDGLVDYINVSGMTYFSWPGWIAEASQPPGMFAHLSEGVRRVVPGLPVAVVSRVGDPHLAERIIASGQADLVGMARALISDPELPAKAARGDLDDIRQCTYGNNCVMGLIGGKGVSCTHNPAVGHERQLGIGTLKPTDKPRHVVVVGGGPAGMAAARAAAARGHRVTMLEKSDTLGGQNRMTAQVASRARYAETTRWYTQALDRLGVTRRFHVDADADRVMAEHPDAIVVATGSRPRQDGYSSHRPDVSRLPGSDRDHVFTVWDVFARSNRLGQRIVLIDEDPHLSAMLTAEHLADLGRQVVVVTPAIHAARSLGQAFVPELLRRVRPKGVVIRTDRIVTRIDGEAVQLEDRYTGETEAVPADSVVLAMGNIAEDSVYHALKSRHADVHAIGDCLAPRRLDDAIRDGERIGRMV